MILSDADIRRRLAEGDLEIEPLADPELQIQPASVDLRLGREFLEFERTNIACIHPDSEDEIEDYVSETVVPEGDDFVLHPGDFVLGTTIERVAVPPDLIAHVEGRSSLGRLAVVVHASLPGDEPVFLWTPDEGFGLYDIGSVVEQERPARAVAFDPRTLRVSTHRVTDYITNPRKRIYRVELESGREVHVTRDHNLFTLDESGGVTRIPSEAAVGEYVMVPDGLPGSPTPARDLDVLDVLDPGEARLYASDGAGATDGESPDDRDGVAAADRTDTPADIDVGLGESGTPVPRERPLTAEFGWVLGFYIATGSREARGVRVASADESDLERFEEFFEERASTSRSRDGRRAALTVRSPVMGALLDELAGAGTGRTVPDAAFDWPGPVRAELLAGLLDGEGRDDRLHTAEAGLANRVAYLGLGLGRAVSIESNGGDAGRDETWTVAFGDRHEAGRGVPVPGTLLRRLRERAGLSTAEAAEATGRPSAAVSAVESGAKPTVDRGTLARFHEAYSGAGVDTTRLGQVLGGDVRFEEVTGVEETDRVERTYDLEVQPGGRSIENFLAGRGGVFLSNTAGLCDPGYRGQITLELSNLGAAPVALSPGMRVSQLTFTELTSPAERPYGESRGSKYQEQEGPQASRLGGDREFGGEQ